MDRINNYAQGVSEIATLESIRNNLGVEASEYTPDESQPERDRVFTFAQQEKILSILADIDTGVANLVEKADTNAENIATNTANIAQNQGSISANNKRISNIEKLLQGNLYDYQTDSTSAYTKTVPSGAMPYAGIEQIGGETVVMNQLFPLLTATSYTYRKNIASIDFVDGVCSFTVNAKGGWFGKTSYNFPITAGHKYFFRTDVKGYAGASIAVYMTAGLYTETKTFTSSEWKTYSSIESAGSSITPSTSFSCTDNTYSDWQEIQTKNVMCVDLTLLCGAGNEPTTVEEFLAMYPSYIATNQGTLLSAGVTEVVSKKADTTILATYSIPAEIQSLEGYGWSAGSVYNYIDYERKVFVQNVVSATYNGTEDWVKQTDITNSYYYLKVGNNGDVVENKVVCDSFETVTIAGSNTNIGIDIINSSDYNAARILIRRADMSGSKYDFKTWLASNNITVNYALSTPIETDISEYLTDDNLISVEAGGSLTFPNSNGDDYRIDVPSQETYMVDLQSAIGG